MWLHRRKWRDVRLHLTGTHGQWRRPSADEIELFNIAKVPVTRYIYRGSKIPSPGTHSHAQRQRPWRARCRETGTTGERYLKVLGETVGLQPAAASAPVPEIPVPRHSAGVCCLTRSGAFTYHDIALPALPPSCESARSIA